MASEHSSSLLEYITAWGHKYVVTFPVKSMTWQALPHDSARKQQNHFLVGGFPRTAPCLYVQSSFAGDSGLPPVFFSVLALLKITVNPSADAGSLTSHSPNFGSGTPFSCGKQISRSQLSTVKAYKNDVYKICKLIMILSCFRCLHRKDNGKFHLNKL